MLPYLFPVLFALGLAGLVVLCIVARRYLSWADQSRASRNALLMAMARVPIGPEPATCAEDEQGAAQDQ